MQRCFAVLPEVAQYYKAYGRRSDLVLIGTQTFDAEKGGRQNFWKICRWRRRAPRLRLDGEPSCPSAAFPAFGRNPRAAHAQVLMCAVHSDYRGCGMGRGAKRARIDKPLRPHRIQCLGLKLPARIGLQLHGMPMSPAGSVPQYSRPRTR